MLSQTGSPVHLRSSAALVSRNSDSSHNSRAGHPGWLRCSSLTYSRYARSSRLAIRAPRSGTYATNHCYGTLETQTRRKTELARRLVVVERLRLTKRRTVVPVRALHRRGRERVERLEGGVVETRVDVDVPALPGGVAGQIADDPAEEHFAPAGLPELLSPRDREIGA